MDKHDPNEASSLPSSSEFKQLVEQANGGDAAALEQLAGPRSTRFTNVAPNITHLFVDNGCWAGPVPEPSTMVLAGFGAVGLAVAASKRRWTARDAQQARAQLRAR